MDQEADVKWFAGFVVNSRWRFAKTYVESYPHEYTLERWGRSRLSGGQFSALSVRASLRRFGMPGESTSMSTIVSTGTWATRHQKTRRSGRP